MPKSNKIQGSDNSSASGVHSVTKAFNILEYLSLQQEPRRLTDISHALDMPASTVIRFLSTLINMGYVSQEPDSEKYFATLRLCGISDKISRGFDICDAARPYIRQLSALCSQTICLAAEHNHKVYYESILLASDRQSISALRRVGQLLPYHCTDVGKIFLAAKTSQQLHNIFSSSHFQKYTAGTITDLSHLQEEIDTIRNTRCAYDREEFSIGVSGFAVPIYNYSNHVAAALGICGLSSQITPEFEDKYIPALIDSAARISVCLGAPMTDGNSE